MVSSSVWSSHPGPSPRGWGERRFEWDAQRSARTIPTRVGRTTSTGIGWTGNKDHPHAGGENAARLSNLAELEGPSPRGWGERIHCPGEWVLGRTIPTRVGRTSQCQHPNVESGDHPHAGGENPGTALGLQPVPGPSPRGWGELRSVHTIAGRPRTIPTRVGRTMLCVNASSAMKDHPHAGGENSGRSARWSGR